MDLALLAIRIGLGIVFVVHGWQKITGMEGTIGFIGSLGFPAFFAYLVTAFEFLGGLAVLLGVFTRWGAAAIAIVMVFAIILVKFKVGFIGGYELDLVLLLNALALIAAGEGKYSVWALLGKNKTAPAKS